MSRAGADRADGAGGADAEFLLDAHLYTYAARVIIEALQAATVAHHQRRAAQFEAALPRPDDYPGRASMSDRAELVRRITAKAQACRHAAEFWRTVHDEGGAR